MIILYIFLLALISLTHQQTVVIYPIYGTFTNSSPYSDPVFRPTALLPLNPSVINTRFYFSLISIILFFSSRSYTTH